MHKISRYDRRPDENLSRQKKKDGTTYAERYVTVQCVDDGLGLTLGVLHVKRLDSVPESAGLILDRLERAGIKVRLLLLDREFFSVEVIAMLQKRNVRFLMPCRNTGNIVAVLNEFAHRDRPAVSKNIIGNNTNSAAYFMVITKRKKSGNGNKTDAAEEEKPEKKFIGFATNRPGIRIESYSSRWGIETGYARVEECRAKTRTVDLAARMLCFYYMMSFNEWMIARALLSEGPGVQNVMTMPGISGVYDRLSQGVQAPFPDARSGYFSLGWFCTKGYMPQNRRDKSIPMMLPICGFDAKNAVLCPQCESKVESGALTRADIDAAFILARLAKENPEIDGFSLKKCREVDGNYVIHLEKNDILTIRQSRTLYRLIQDQFPGKIWLVESEEGDKRFIEDLLFPTKILSINSVWAPGGIQKTKAVVLGRWTPKFPVDLDKVKQIVKNARDLEIDIEFEEVRGQ